MRGFGAYGEGKGGLGPSARTASAELGEQGIRVNAVSPGPIDTAVFDKMGLPPQATAGLKAQMRERIPIGRFGRAEEIANIDRKSTRLNSSHQIISYAVFCLKNKYADAPITP